MSSPYRGELKARAYEKYSAKAVLVKMEELADRGYLNYGVSVSGAWLTDKGRRALEEAEKTP